MDTPAAVRVRHRRRPGRWVGVVVAVAVTVTVGRAFWTSPNIQWRAVADYLTDGTILEGARLTVFLAVVSQAIGIAVGIALALMRMSLNPILNVLGEAYVFVFRGTPALLQIIFWYNLALIFPRLSLTVPGTTWGISADTNAVMSATVAAIIALSLNEAAYMAEIIRSGLESVDPGQSEAASAIGLRSLQRFRYVILPQAIRTIVPPTGNEFINMLKSTSLVSVIAASELLNAARTIYSRNFLTIELLLVASVWYLVMTTVAMLLQSLLERRLGRVDRHQHRSGMSLLLTRAERHPADWGAEL